MRFESIPPISLLVGSRFSETTAREHDWQFVFSCGVCIVAEGHWRLIADGRVIATDEDSGQMFGHKEPVNAAAVIETELSGATIDEVEISSVGDLTISFSNGRRLQVLVSSAGYENWHVYGPDKSHTFAIGGGELHHMSSGSR